MAEKHSWKNPIFLDETKLREKFDRPETWLLLNLISVAELFCVHSVQSSLWRKYAWDI